MLPAVGGADHPIEPASCSPSRSPNLLDSKKLFPPLGAINRTAPYVYLFTYVARASGKVTHLVLYMYMYICVYIQVCINRCIYIYICTYTKVEYNPFPNPAPEVNAPLVPPRFPLRGFQRGYKNQLKSKTKLKSFGHHMAWGIWVTTCILWHESMSSETSSRRPVVNQL